MSDVIDIDMDTPCPSCGGKLRTIRNSNKELFMNIAKYIVYCNTCPFEEDAVEFQKRLESK